ncbi:unnamed protein product [Notodromas monacha]|uniref:Uncharacterized protein n=1 Tax=Notodromas monacha TaxID=399045 RepID=A0A7R9GKF9_9CRUS|nr:unnamed protein product [Notodromas monacha]CAG0924581.1 unnamed protein product [Notodromas monacha]
MKIAKCRSSWCRELDVDFVVRFLILVMLPDELHAEAICFGLELTQCLNKTWGAFACAGSCPYWLDSGKTAPGIPPGLPHHHSTDHGPKECFGNGLFHINPAVIGSGGDPFRQMDEILSQKMFLEVFSADFLCLDPKRAVSGRFVVGSSV